HDRATSGILGDFAARGVTVARGAIQVAGGRRGINRLEMPSLSILSHDPALAQVDVPVDLEAITVELSTAIQEAVDPSGYIRVTTMDPLIGEEITASHFEIGFALRNGEPSRRFIEIKRKENAL